jgi:hypothetical protein
LSSSKSKKTRSRRGKRTTSTITPDIGQLFIDPLASESEESSIVLEPEAVRSGRVQPHIEEPLLSDFSFSDEQIDEKPTRRATSKGKDKKIKPISLEPETTAPDARVSLLSDFWVDEEVVEDEKEGDRFHEFFADSIQNTKIRSRDADDSLSKRIQVGLYPADANLLEELFLQSKAAGLKNVSRARILRVALRHFHTCWLNADNR